MLQIGITGGIGAGKTVVCRIFRTLGIPVYDADTRAKQLMATDQSLIQAITSAFGREAYTTTGHINRDYLAKTAFSSPEKTQKLNALVHPAVASDYTSWVKKQNAPYVIKEAALLIEAGSYKQLDRLIVVTSPLPIRINRIKVRDPFRSDEEIKNIIDKQLTDSQREEKADYIIRNDEKQLVIEQILTLDALFRKQ